ncbi:CaiB/BaiF CoA-transferase family protein [Falsiroseomonas stagni]|uniref:Crotonobetainyl-CoA:carnitine CoA-transferase CaiB n=1 Tax=Falsiroseomonas stagni DSM 19981 TaxID=1123062 RepID=A0A1I4AX00_9PROT|nr:CoA transferase [Falsiroseomonas stagni]SFK60823.1 Crotonobetainyl-CoA:carnitine CoA-transferase CaiB [Falsiroseomonas stagni DSM 19981]
MAPALAPLAGLRVLELGSDVSLAFAARLLADLGAEVVRPEMPGDALRHAAPEGTLFAYLNAGKRLVVATPDQVSALAREAGLVLWARDAAPGAPLPAQDDPARAPTLVLTAHGLTGPRAGDPGNAFTTQHGGGYAWHQACPVTDPEAAPPLGCPDREAAMLVGLVAANAAMAALAEPPGPSAPWIDLASEDVFAWMLVDALAELHDGVLAPGRRRMPGREITIAGGLIWLLPCADGTIVVSPREDHQWARWVALMGDPDWAKDAALCGTRATRTKHAAEIGRLMREWSATVASRPVFEAAQAARVACFPISTAPDLLANRQLAARGFFRPLALADGGTLPLPGLPFAMRDGAGAALPRGAPAVWPKPDGAARFHTTPAAPSLSDARHQRPLSGVRVVDFSWVVAGPMATKMLGALGAEIIKIESSQRAEFAMRGGWFAVINNNKRSTTVDITTAGGQGLIRDLVERSDVVVENFSSRVLTKNGLSYADLAAVKPDIVYVSASGLGRQGPERDLLAYGSLLQCYSGRVGLIGRANPQLEAMGVMPAWTDPVTSLWESLAILAALRHRAATGLGAHIDLSMLEATVALLPDALLHAGLGRTVPRNGSAEDLSGAPSGLFRCAGPDEWLALSATTEAQRQALSRVIGATTQDAIASWCHSRDARQAETVLRAAGIPATRSRGIFDLVEDPHLAARRLFQPVDGGGWSIALPWMQASGDRGRLAPVPRLGADNEDVFGRLLGLDAARLQALAQAGVIR